MCFSFPVGLLAGSNFTRAVGWGFVGLLACVACAWQRTRQPKMYSHMQVQVTAENAGPGHTLVVVKEATIRARASPSSKKVGTLTVGQTVTVLQVKLVEGHQRVQISAAPGGPLSQWASATTANGNVLMQLAPQQAPRFWNLVKSGSLVDRLGHTHNPTQLGLREKTAIGIFFSGHWCPPSREFTPGLIDAYDTWARQKGFEIIFCSSDQTEAEFRHYREWSIDRPCCGRSCATLTFLGPTSGSYL
jgi:hypothetical protein